MLEVKISIIGKTDEDIITAINQVKAKIEEGYINECKANHDHWAWHFSLSDTKER